MLAHSITRRVGLLAIVMLGGCSSDRAKPEGGCAAGHCDLPTDPDEVSCVHRRNDAFNPNRLAFNEPFLRWSCADVPGVTKGHRGQEYCEYFAIAQLPADGAELAPAPMVLGKNLGTDESAGTTPVSVPLSPTQIAALEANDTNVVGQCMFTSWNSDIPLGIPACGGAGQVPCPTVDGLPIDEDTFRMKFGVNSTEAAQNLVTDCFTLPIDGDPKRPGDLRHDDFMRGCLFDAVVNHTAYRKSDTDVCASMVRLAECGCSVRGPDDLDLAHAIAPWSMRGFQLGGWTGFVSGDEAASKLPTGCHYVSLGDNSQTLVACDFTAADLIAGAMDIKSYCQAKYADVVVVHLPIPGAALTCDSETSQSPYTGSCSATPWVLTDPTEL